MTSPAIPAKPYCTRPLVSLAKPAEWGGGLGSNILPGMQFLLLTDGSFLLRVLASLLTLCLGACCSLTIGAFLLTIGAFSLPIGA